MGHADGRRAGAGGLRRYPTLQQGSHGPAVRKLQRLLNDHLPDLQLAVDGRFGPVTDGRVRQFQQRFAIVVDGIVGPQTWGHLTQ
ncbi:peptidoglycan-binding protein [Streptomyces sp. LBUM 1481]|nr:peptidoglycan-binding protein [Streptomyces sp. LBUM 1481]